MTGDTTIPLSTLFAILGVVVSSAVAIYAFLVRVAFTTYEKTIEKRFVELETERKEVAIEERRKVEKLHETDKLVLVLQGEVRLLEAHHDRSKQDITDMRNEMVTKDEWNPRMENLEKTCDGILKEVKELRTPRYGYGGSAPRMPATKPEDPRTR